MVYSTYLGGSGMSGHGIAVDSAGNAYVTGYTTSTDFPVTPGAFQTTQRRQWNAFVTELILRDRLWSTPPIWAAALSPDEDEG